MRVFVSTKYEVIGFNPRGNMFNGWVLRERSSNVESSSAIIIIDSAKYISDGYVYFLEADGRVNCKGREVSFKGIRPLESVYEPAYLRC